MENCKLFFKYVSNNGFTQSVLPMRLVVAHYLSGSEYWQTDGVTGNLLSLLCSTLGVVSLAAVFVSSRNAPPQRRLFTFEPHSFPIVISIHRNDQSFIRKLKITSIFAQIMSPCNFRLLCFGKLIGLGTNPRTVVQYEASLSVVLFCSFYKTNIPCFRTSVQ